MRKPPRRCALRFGPKRQVVEPARSRSSLRTVCGIGGVLLCALALLVPSAALAVEDTVAPELVELSISPASVDTSAGPATITFTARVTDNLSGVSQVGGIARKPSGGNFSGISLFRITGTALDGVYQGTLTLPQFSEHGTWSLGSFHVTDVVNNTRQFTTAQLEDAGFPTTFENVEDATGPTTTITRAPTLPNGQGGWYVSDVTLTVAATDNAGGLGIAETRCLLRPASAPAPATFDDIAAGCAYTGAGAGVTTDGMHVLYAASADGAGNEETPTSASFMIDQTDPTVSCDAASPGPGFLLLGSGGFVSATVTDASSGPLQNEAGAANVATVGNKTVSLTGKDLAGNTTIGSCPYRVSYRFLGFQNLKPSYKSNQTIPVKFMLATAAGTAISDPSAQALLTPCRVKITVDGVEQTGCASYDMATDTFQYNVKKGLATGSHVLAIKVSAPDGSVVNTNGSTVTITS